MRACAIFVRNQVDNLGKVNYPRGPHRGRAEGHGSAERDPVKSAYPANQPRAPRSPRRGRRGGGAQGGDHRTPQHWPQGRAKRSSERCEQRPKAAKSRGGEATRAAACGCLPPGEEAAAPKPRRGPSGGDPAAHAKPKADPEQSKGNQSASGGSPQRSGWGGGAAGAARAPRARSEARAQRGPSEGAGGERRGAGPASEARAQTPDRAREAARAARPAGGGPGSPRRGPAGISPRSGQKAKGAAPPGLSEERATPKQGRIPLEFRARNERRNGRSGGVLSAGAKRGPRGMGPRCAASGALWWRG